ncbi:MAG TPA: DUF2336 domain-containing protein [Allosphingosinicella sp.]
MSDQRATSVDRQGDGARLLKAAARQRSVALADLFLPEPFRLNDWQRATVRFLLERLVRTVEDDLRATLAETFADEEAAAAALSSAQVEIAQPLLDRSAALQDPELVGVLLRRAEEHRLYRAGAPNAAEALLRELIRDRDEGVAAEAMAVLVGTSRRLDRFLEPVTARTELSADLQHRLVWTVAAALRLYLTEQHGIEASRADEAIAAAAAAILGPYDEGDTLEARAVRLARRLDQAGRLDDSLIARFAAEGSLPLLLAALAARTGFAYACLWEIVSAPGGRGAALLVRAAGLGREEAAAILLRLAGPSVPEDLIAAQIDLFDGLDTEQAIRGLRVWTLDPAYRAAVIRLGEAA